MTKLCPVGFIAALCLCAAFVMSGCFSRSPDPFAEQMQQMYAEKTQAAANCNQEISALTAFYGDHEDTAERESKAGEDCFKKNQQTHEALARAGLAGTSFEQAISGKGDSECIDHMQKAAHAISELTGGSEPNVQQCETSDRAGCTEATDQAARLASKLDQETEPCVKEKIGKPITGICAIDGLGQDCILALDDGTLCMPNGPRLPACNQLVRIENRARQLGAAYQESARTEALRSQAAAAWAQVGATQRANSFPRNTTCMPFGPGVTCNSW
jgi:hypothetical protein